MPYEDEYGNTVYTEDDVREAAALGAQNALTAAQGPVQQQNYGDQYDALFGAMSHLSQQISEQNQSAATAASSSAAEQAAETLRAEYPGDFDRDRETLGEFISEDTGRWLPAENTTDPDVLTDHLRTAYRELRVRSGLPATPAGYAADSSVAKKKRDDEAFAKELVSAYEDVKPYSARMAKGDKNLRPLYRS